MADEVLARIDSRLERGNELMLEIKSLVGDVKSVVGDLKIEVANNRAQYERGLRTYERLETFTKDLSRRNEAVSWEMIREIRDLRDESVAQRDALLTLIDEFRSRRGGPPQG